MSSHTMPSLDNLLASAARLQELVPGAVLVGGAAAAYRAHHRLSIDHDHVVADLSHRFDVVLDALERENEWVTNRLTYGTLILGDLGGIETGIRQLIRHHPVEMEEVILSHGERLIVPTYEETLRIKAFLIVKRNQTRDYLDVAAMGADFGITETARVLSHIDEFYSDHDPDEGYVAAQVARQLAKPQPKDISTTRRLADYKGLIPRWHEWNHVEAVCQTISDAMLTF